MTHSPVVAPRQVESLVSPLSGTIGAPITGPFRTTAADAATRSSSGPGAVVTP